MKSIEASGSLFFRTGLKDAGVTGLTPLPKQINYLKDYRLPAGKPT
jgi:hypothetical protein